MPCAALSNIGPGAKVAAPALKSALFDSGQGLRVDVAEALLSINREPADIVPVLTKSLHSSATADRDKVVALLKTLGPWAAPALPELIEALKVENGPDRSGVVEALGEIGPKAAQAIPELSKALQHDEEGYVRANAATALGKIGDPQVIPLLIAALKDDDSYVRFSAIEALEPFGHKAKAAAPALIGLINNDQEIGVFAAAAVGAVDAEGSSVSALIKALENENPDMRRFAAFGIGHLGAKAVAAKEALRRGLRDEDRGARIAAAEALWSVSGKADEAVPVLRSILQASGGWLSQSRALDALAEIGPPAKAAVPELMEYLKSNDADVVTSSAAALGKIGPGSKSAIPALTARLKSSDNQYTRVCIAQALWRIDRYEESLQVLQDALKNSNDFMVLSEAAGAIGEMGQKATGSAELLAPLLKSTDSFVRDAAAKALKQLERK